MIDNTIICGDCLEVMKDWPDGCVDLVLTDPPYPREFLPCWSILSDISRQSLKPNKYCVAYSGTMFLPEVHNRLGEHLTYQWQAVLVHAGANQFLHPRRVIIGSKPVLIYCNGLKGEKRNGYLLDTIRGTGRDKEFHEWGQEFKELQHLIDYYSDVNDLILDPFCGSGTTCVAAKMLGRRYIGIDISPEYCQIAEDRLRAVDTGVPVKEARAGQGALFD